MPDGALEELDRVVWGLLRSRRSQYVGRDRATVATFQSSLTPFALLANYLGDTWAFDLTEYKWREITFPLTAQKPCARSGMSLLPCAEGVVLSGGYAKMYEKGKKTKGVALEDTWTLRCASFELCF